MSTTFLLFLIFYSFFLKKVLVIGKIKVLFYAAISIFVEKNKELSIF